MKKPLKSNLNILNNSQEEFDIKKILKPYIRKWKWFIYSLLVSLVLTFFNIRYATPEYNASAKIMITHEDATSSPEGALLQELGGVSAVGKKEIEDEIEILTSRKIMKGVIEKLNLNIQFYAKGRLHDTQYFPNEKAPFKINFIESDSIIDKSNYSFSLLVTSETTFDFIEVPTPGADEVIINRNFGENISTPIGDIVITPNINNILKLNENIIYINIVAVNKLAESYKKALLVKSAGEFSKVINISFNDTSIPRAKAIINTLVHEYNRTSIEEKNTKASNTADFIDKRIDLIATDLSKVDDEIEQFKTGNKLTDITSEAEIYINTNAVTQQDLAVSRTELNMVNYMKNQVSNDSFERIPSNVGLTDASVNTMAQKYNELLDDRDRLLKSSSEKNPIIVNLDQQLNNLKQNLRNSLNNSAKTVGLKIRSLENQSAQMSSKIYSVPGQVRKSRDIEREQGIKETLYLFLLEKREEATIALRSTSANSKIIDDAYSTGNQVSPNVVINYMAGIILGFCIPFGLIYVINLFDNKIHNKEDLEDIIKDIPVLGEIPKISNSDKKLIERNDRSVLAESFRIIRTNFDYIRRKSENKKYSNVIFVTSTINGEGKSFVSLNTALTFANTNKKVLLIGADLRNPQLFSSINDNKNQERSKIGLTEYLTDNSVSLEQAIDSHSINAINIDILLSGNIPPNPAELLMNDRLQELFDQVSEQYDYVVVDTAPSMLVTDTLLISEYAAYTIYLTRADYTEKRILNFAKELNNEDKLNGMMLVVNDVMQSNFGYGAKYGYYGKPEKKGFFRRRKKA